MAISFDGPNKLISLSLGTTSLDLTNLWSRAVDWWLTSDNSKYIFPMTQVGGDSIDAAAGTTIPFYFFLQSGWKIKPQEASHTLAVTKGVILVQGGGDPFVNTTGSYVVRINYSQPVQAITVATGGGGSAPTAAEVAAAVRVELTTELTHIMQVPTTGAALTTPQATMLLEMYNLMGLDPAKPLVVTKTARTVTGINQQITGDSNTTVVTRI